MAQYTCISIGINNYDHFQPLSYAIADAEGLVQCLQDQVNLGDQQSLLLTEVSPRIGQFSTYPDRENILHWLASPPSESSQPTLNASSVLWFFFSGYGLHYQGEDYLMPIDGDPQDLPNTALPVRSIFTLLQQQGAGKIIAIFDMNRTPGMLGEKGVGEQLINLAGKMGIACILSAHPHQVSHEAASLGHGLFTTALLEALKYYRRDLTLEYLDHYLNERLPELSEHHWRPVQNPIMVLPILEAAQTPVLPALVSSGIIWHNNPQLLLQNSFKNLNQIIIEDLTPVGVATNGTANALYPKSEVSVDSSPLFIGNNSIPNPPLLSQEPPELPRAKRQTLIKKTSSSWLRFLIGSKNILIKGTVSIVVIILGIFGLNKLIPQLDFINSEINEPSNKNNTPIPQASNENNTPIIQPSINNTPTPEPTTNQNSNNSQNNTNQPQKLDDIGKTYLQQAKDYFRNDQASHFNNAINQARKVPTNDASYSQAQADISRWSKNIWDIAQSRAIQGNLTGAIAAAKLIPSDQKQLYTEAQNKIKEWTNQSLKAKNNSELLRKAKSLINPRQASSYIKAMQMLEIIKVNQTGYQEARKLRQQWSRQVYLIANSRAYRGKFELAIKTALLIPPDSNSYRDAQRAIARWKQGKK